MKKFWVVVVFFLVIPPIFADQKVGASFLKIPIGARALGMGQALTATASDVDALNWNPAGLSQAMFRPHDSTYLSFSRAMVGSENNLDQAGLVGPLNKLTLGLNVFRLSYPDIDARSETGSRLGHLSASDTAMGLGIGTTWHQVHYGTQVKWIVQKLGNISAQGIAVDLGFMSSFGSREWLFGGAVRNWGTGMKFSQERYQLPLTISGGTSYKLLKTLSLSADVHWRPRDQQQAISLGSEFLVSDMMAMRVGYLNNRKSNASHSIAESQDILSRMGGVTGGIGLHMKRFLLDYAISPFGDLGQTQSLTLSTWFGSSHVVPNSPESKNDAISNKTRVIFDSPQAQ